MLELTYRPFVEASSSGDLGVDVSTGLTRGRGGAPQPAVEDLVGALENGVMTTSAVYDPRDLGEGSQGYKRWRSALSIPYPYGSHRGEDDGLVP